MKRMLIIEDEESIRMLLEDDFKVEGYEVLTAANGLRGMEISSKEDFDIILLDLMLPGLDGIEICKRLRRMGNDTPIIMLTAKSDEIDRVVGLEIGADDYVTKPFSPRELQARVKAIIRRSGRSSALVKSEKYAVGDLQIDLLRHTVIKNGKEIKLTALEFSLLRYFLENQFRVLTRDDILDEVWTPDVVVQPRTVDAHIANLRKKIEDEPANPRWILGVHGVGYKAVFK